MKMAVPGVATVRTFLTAGTGLGEEPAVNYKTN